ncbi:MAG: ABC transporter ATP-binding protein [Planctomycetales bacterium]|nr:ABC transporter ATP-binding protein [Planctomycetales bacterium]
MIELIDVSMRAGEFRLDSVSAVIPNGAYGVLMGRTGSGKTTLLEAVCGLKQVAGGRIRLNGHDVTRLHPAMRDIGFVPQDGALFPSMTIEQHLRFALDIRKWRPEPARQRVEELAEMLQIKHLLQRRPVGLSGGERQRVALGRALSYHPSTLCLDEPLSALDDKTRDDMMTLLKKVQTQLGVTALHVTHSHLEAERLADRLLRVEDGQIVIER